VRLLGLDLSLTSTGYCVEEKTGVIALKLKGAERLSRVSDEIIKIIKTNAIDVAIIEGYSFASRNSQAHSIGEMGGAVRMKLWEMNIPYVEVPPTCRAKTEVISAISAKTGLTFLGAGADDECDAWILRQMGLAYIGESKESWTKEQLEALIKVDWSPIEGMREVS
jgi:crossover junction endodeoxyribonuclease RuvC